MNSLVSSKSLERHTIELLLKNAQSFLDRGPSGHTGATVVNLFFEPSTRTNLSFQMAAGRLGLKTLHFDVNQSSTNKGESLLDTLQTLEALGVDLAVIRHAEDWPSIVSDSGLSLGLVNAGSGVFDHPTQALLDALTKRQHFNRWRDIRVTIVGDIRHSRVARSNYNLLTKLGAIVQFAGPEGFRPEDLNEAAWVDLDGALLDTDVLMLLRVQHERHTSKYDAETYHAQFGLTKDRLLRLNKNALIMHPGPVNRGVEICDAAMEDPRCRVDRQVTNGVAVRMAVLDWCLQGGRHGKLVSA